jgi:ferredoxin-NADP reductase
MPTVWYEGEIIEIKDVAENTKSFKLRVNSEETFSYTAGQFVTFNLPVSTKRIHSWKSYSIANVCNNDNVLEFCIVRMPGGLATKYLFEEVCIGDTIRFKGPEGSFVLPPDLNHDVVLICTGTGVAPFRAMIQDLLKHRSTTPKVHLIFGTRYEKDILYKDEFEHLSLNHPEFKFSVALSRENIEPHVHGYIHKVYEQHMPEYSQNTHFYLCGWTSMVDEAVAGLMINHQVEKSKIHYELYG